MRGSPLSNRRQVSGAVGVPAPGGTIGFAIVDLVRIAVRSPAPTMANRPFWSQSDPECSSVDGLIGDLLERRQRLVTGVIETVLDELVGDRGQSLYVVLSRTLFSEPVSMYER